MAAAPLDGLVTRPPVLVTRPLRDEILSFLRSRCEIEVPEVDRAMPREELLSRVVGKHGLLTMLTDRIDDEVLDVAGGSLRVVANHAVGFDNVDVAACTRRGVVVTNTPDVLTDDTADLAITLLLMVARRTGEGERHVRAGAWTGWRPTHMLGTRVTGKTLGVIGMGRIGQAVAQRARLGFGMRILYHDPFPPPKEALAGLDAERRDTVEEVLAEADFVTLHCPASPETRHLMNAERLARMKRSAFLVNSARGDVVDERALVETLKAGRIAGAALDVYEREPGVTPELLEMESVVLLPHLGSATLETREAMGFRALENLKAFFAGAEPRDRVA